MKKTLAKILTSLVITLSASNISQGATFNVDYNKNPQLSNTINNLSLKSSEELKSWFDNKFDNKINISVLNDKDFNKIIGNGKISIDGFAVSEQDLIVLKESALVGKTTEDIRRLLKHEISHIFLATTFKNFSYDKFPRWLNEGLSQFLSDGGSEIYSYSYQNSLQSAFITGNLIPFSSLVYYFPSDKDNFSLAYAQSISFIEFLVKKFGQDKLKVLLGELDKNDSFYKSFENVYKENFFLVENLWKNENKSSQYTLDYYFATHINSIIDALMVFVFFLTFIVAFFRNKKRKKIMHEMEKLSQHH
ncbi:MAG: peptidase MA family metallohydrolase [Candidatus Sericytochromatia bacterium]